MLSFSLQHMLCYFIYTQHNIPLFSFMHNKVHTHMNCQLTPMLSLEYYHTRYSGTHHNICCWVSRRWGCLHRIACPLVNASTTHLGLQACTQPCHTTHTAEHMPAAILEVINSFISTPHACFHCYSLSLSFPYHRSHCLG